MLEPEPFQQWLGGKIKHPSLGVIYIYIYICIYVVETPRIVGHDFLNLIGTLAGLPKFDIETAITADAGQVNRSIDRGTNERVRSNG